MSTVTRVAVAVVIISSSLMLALAIYGLVFMRVLHGECPDWWITGIVAASVSTLVSWCTYEVTRR